MSMFLKRFVSGGTTIILKETSGGSYLVKSNKLVLCTFDKSSQAQAEAFFTAKVREIISDNH